MIINQAHNAYYNNIQAFWGDFLIINKNVNVRLMYSLRLLIYYLKFNFVPGLEEGGLVWKKFSAKIANISLK